MMRLNNLLKDWKFALLEGEFVTELSLQRLEDRLKETYHLVPFGVPTESRSLSDYYTESVNLVKEFNGNE